MPMAINFGRLEIYNYNYFHKVTRSLDHVVLQDHVNYFYFSCCINTTTRPMATERSKVVTYFNILSHTTH